MTAPSSDQADVEFLHTDNVAVVGTSRDLAENRNISVGRLRENGQLLLCPLPRVLCPQKICYARQVAGLAGSCAIAQQDKNSGSERFSA